MVGSIYHEDGRLRASVLAPGGVVKAAEHTCRGKYQELGSKFLPLVFETHGRMKRGVGEHSQAAGEDGAKLLEVSSIPKAQGGVRRRVVDAVQCGGDA